MGSSPELLEEPALRPLWLAVHRRLEQTGGTVDEAAVHLRDLDDSQRAAVDRLLGRRSRGKTIRVELAALSILLCDRIGRDLSEVVGDLVGPLRDRPGERIERTATEAALWERLRSHPAVGKHPDLDDWLDGWRARGAWRRFDEPERRFGEALSVLGELPVAVRTGRSDLAARVLGDAHGLDDDRVVGRLVVSALARDGGLGTGRLRAADRRRLWVGQGVVVDEISSSVVTSGVVPIGAGPLTEAAARWGSTGVPLPLPLAALVAEPWRVARGTPVWVCENPSVLAAAAASATGAAVVCVEGRPSVAAQALLRSLVESGARLSYHGDLGAGGIAIANDVIDQFGAAPWRMGVTDFEIGLERAGEAGTVLPPLRGTVPAASWDPALAPAVREAGVEVEEELVLDLLLDDLADGVGRRALGSGQ